MRIAIFLSIIVVFTGSLCAENVGFGKFNLKTGQQSSTEDAAPQGVTGASTRCGMKLSLPAGWKVIHDEPNRFDAQGPRGMWLAVNMSDCGPGFPMEASLNAYAEGAKKDKKSGKLTSWQERVIDGVRGIQRVEASMPGPTDPRRITWVGYKGTIGINIVASSQSKDFDSCFPALNQIVGSIKW